MPHAASPLSYAALAFVKILLLKGRMRPFSNTARLTRGIGFSLAMLVAFPAAAAEATIAVAANFRSVLDQLEPAFEAETGHDLVVASGSTGKFYAQIVNGAPFDVFLSADRERPIRLEAAGTAITGSRFTYAVGRLAVWAPKETEIGAEHLARNDFRRIALANPDLAPYGAAAQDVIVALDLDEATAKKRVLGENVAQAFSFVRTGNAEVGFVALSQILTLPVSERGAYWAPPGDHYSPINQDAVLLAHGAENPAAYAFLEFLKSEEARAIIEQAGYSVP